MGGDGDGGGGTVHGEGGDGDGGGGIATWTMLPQKDDSNADATDARELPWNMNELLGDEAIDCSVDVDTVPKPMAKIEMPADLTLVAVVIAVLEPP